MYIYKMEEIKQLEKEIETTNKFTHKNIDNYMNKIYLLKKQNFENSKNYTILQHLQEYLQYQSQKLDSLKTTILSLISTIFLPLGFITGFFGMNFGSMGNPDIKNGILSVKNSHKFILILSIISILGTLGLYKYIFDSVLL
jgi:Mg2+ and Co2+ transporter CorA